MSETERFREHWVSIDAERLARYEAMYQWTAAAEAFYAPAGIGAGQTVADFGCGPGHAAVEFARRVGPTGHVHALDINAEFIARTRAKARAAGLADRITAHLLEDAGLPLADAALDRIVTRNTLVYVHDPVATFAEFRRVLKPGGIAHAVEGDWSLTAVEPLPTAEWRALVEAASWAWRTPEIGRKLYGIVRRAGFSDVAVQVITRPDMEGRLLGMIHTVADYARDGATFDPARIDAVRQAVARGLADGTYLAIAPQFLVTAVA
jgi:ubiquinone/menaquinone biosynthesis C-methylase UbiE